MFKSSPSDPSLIKIRDFEITEFSNFPSDPLCTP